MGAAERSHRGGWGWPLAAVVVLAWLGLCRASSSDGATTFAVIVDTSRYWLNYRHNANAFAVYQSVRRLGIPDSRIVLMVAEDFTDNPRNVFPGQLFIDPQHEVDVAGGSSAPTIDYYGDEVSVESLVRVLTGQHAPWVPRSKRLLSSRDDRVLLYVTGHGGENFMKFRDDEQMTGEDLAVALAAMHAGGRYGELLLVVDTCKAATWYQHVTSPNVVCIGSSLRGENSYSQSYSSTLGVPLIDQLTHGLHRALLRGGKGGTVVGLAEALNRSVTSSTVDLRAIALERPLGDLRVADFFAASN